MADLKRTWLELKWQKEYFKFSNIVHITLLNFTLRFAVLRNLATHLRNWMAGIYDLIGICLACLFIWLPDYECFAYAAYSYYIYI